MDEIAVVVLSEEQVPTNLESLQAILLKNGLEGTYSVEGEFLHLSNDDGKFEFSIYEATKDEFGESGPGIDIAGDFDDFAGTLIELMEVFDAAFPESEFSSPYLDDDDFGDEEDVEEDDQDDFYIPLFEKIVELGEMLSYRGIDLNVKDRNEFGQFTNDEFYSINKIEELAREFVKIQDPFENVNLERMNPLFEAYFAFSLSVSLDGLLEFENNDYLISWQLKDKEIKRIKSRDFLSKLLDHKVSSYKRYIELVEKHKIYS